MADGKIPRRSRQSRHPLGREQLSIGSGSPRGAAAGLPGYSYFGVDNSITTTSGRPAARNDFIGALTQNATG